MSFEYTFSMIRPGALRRKVAIEIIERIKEVGLTIEYFEKKELTSEFIYEHYKHLLNPDIPPDVFVRAMVENLSGEVIGMIISGENAVLKMRQLIGPGIVKKAIEEFPNSIRAKGDPNNNPDNLIHASDSPDAAKIEIERFFGNNIENLLGLLTVCEIKKELIY